jgi:anti-sigma factor ChrR (cupin superfamily)
MSSSYIDIDSLPWRPTPFRGVSWRKLSFAPESGRSCVLLRFDPGAHYGAHRHPEGEQYLVLQGEIEDGGVTYGERTFVDHAPGSAHRPSSQRGCLLLVVLPKPIELLEEPLER